ncbi:hypothetical protein [Cellulomonas sp. ES6]|uniref:hypothetical protein n=1 Tax=Cellulomonas sp. ES6 TaxID=3039384 RepID=UPI0024B698AB|nr:hypothetical protein [Cellulomonas sp. ES6]WHP19293.1 hypothetical protein P9841_09480 [Cellulomonas sp. ES6]
MPETSTSAPAAPEIIATFHRARFAMQRARLRLKEAEREAAVAAAVAVDMAVSLDKAWSAAVEWTFWVVAIDEIVRRVLTDEQREDLAFEGGAGDALARIGDRLDGLRYLRNLHAHQLADTLQVRARDTAAGQPVPRLAWAPIDALPPSDRTGKAAREGKEAYRLHIAGQLVGPIAQRIDVGYASGAWSAALARHAPAPKPVGRIARRQD